MTLVTGSLVLEETKAREEIIKSIRDLCTVKLTLPLGNPNLKLVHTNQFLFTELPNEVFELANMEILAEAMSTNSYTRYSGYSVNRWYIEGVTIRNSADGEATMELTLNPFASPLMDFKDERNVLNILLANNQFKQNKELNDKELNQIWLPLWREYSTNYNLLVSAEKDAIRLGFESVEALTDFMDELLSFHKGIRIKCDDFKYACHVGGME